MRDPYRAPKAAEGTVLVSPAQAREKERQRLVRMAEEKGRAARQKLLARHKQPIHIVKEEKGRARRKRREQRLRSLSWQAAPLARPGVYEE